MCSNVTFPSNARNTYLTKADQGGVLWTGALRPAVHAGAPNASSLRCRGTFYVLYEVKEDLGEGAFGKVVRVRRRRDGRLFVAKIMHDRGMSEKARQEVRPIDVAQRVVDMPQDKWPVCRAIDALHTRAEGSGSMHAGTE